MKYDEHAWTYRGGVSTLPMQTPAERARERYEAAQRVKAKRELRKVLIALNVDMDRIKVR